MARLDFKAVGTLGPKVLNTLAADTISMSTLICGSLQNSPKSRTDDLTSGSNQRKSHTRVNVLAVKLMPPSVTARSACDLSVVEDGHGILLDNPSAFYLLLFVQLHVIGREQP